MMATSKLSYVFLCLLALGNVCVAFPKAAKRELVLHLNDKNASVLVPQDVKWMTLTLGKKATIDFSGVCSSAKPASVSLQYHLLMTACANYLDEVGADAVMAKSFGKAPIYATKTVEIVLQCEAGDENQVFTERAPSEVWKKDPLYEQACFGPAEQKKKDPTKTANKDKNGATHKKKDPIKTANEDKNPSASKKKRSLVRGAVDNLVASLLHARTKRRPQPHMYNDSAKENVCTAKQRNVFALVFVAQASKTTGMDINVTVNVEMKNTWGYLSALDYPNLVFYGVMTALYTVYAFIWLLALACQYRDLLRVQFWIGAVIALGMIEKVFFFSEYSNVNVNGNEGKSLLATAEMISAGKRTLARLLVIIISLGFGIVKPRLGPNLVIVVGIGMVYFTAASIEGISRVMSSSEEVGTTKGQVMSLAVVLLDVAIIYFIYASITDTMRTLRLRRNTIKLALYRHFSNAIIFAVVASVAFSTWMYLQFRSTDCIEDWEEIWLLDGFWHILFCFLLLVMMVLWRPSANNNRYAYSPLVDLGSNEDEPEQMPSEAFDGMKLRNLGQERKTVPSSSVDDDLKWVEENIPTSLVDAAVPVLMDSEDELNVSRFEVSKMQ